MIHVIDQQTLQRIIGRDAIPSQVEDEYSIRLSMYHRAGESGPLGIIGCIDLVRSLGVMIVPDAAKPGEVDWRTVPSNGTVLVKVGPFVGQFYRGYFVGCAPSGTLGVKMIEGDYPPGWVLEVRKDMTTIVNQDADGNDLDDLDPAAEGRRREAAQLEAERALAAREASEKLRAAKAEAGKLERALERDGESATVAQKLADAQAEIDALKAKLQAKPQPIVVKTPTPPAKKPVAKAKKAKVAPPPKNDEPPRDENGEIIYKEYTPPAEDAPALRANLDLIQALEPETPVFVTLGEGDEAEVMDAIFQGTENELVHVLVDGETEPRTVAATAITLIT